MVASTNSGAKSGTCVGWIVFINSASACPGTLFSHSFCMKRCLLTSRHQLSTVAAAGVSENETTHMHSTSITWGAPPTSVDLYSSNETFVCRITIFCPEGFPSHRNREGILASKETEACNV